MRQRTSAAVLIGAAVLILCGCVVPKAFKSENSASLKPGMSAKVEIFVSRLPDVVYVPVQAVSAADGKQVCYLAVLVDRLEAPADPAIPAQTRRSIPENGA